MHIDYTPEFLTARMVAAELKMKLDSVRHALYRGSLRGEKNKNEWRIHRDDLERYKEKTKPRPEKEKPQKPSLADRFWARVDKSSDCWTWKGSTYPSGYGHLSVNDKSTYAHRVAYELTRGPIPDGLFVCHHCDNPPCVRPEHLFLGTAMDNARDRDRKNRGGARTSRTSFMVNLVCDNCGKAFQRPDFAVQYSINRGHMHSFCSRHCACVYAGFGGKARS